MKVSGSSVKETRGGHPSRGPALGWAVKVSHVRGDPVFRFASIVEENRVSLDVQFGVRNCANGAEHPDPSAASSATGSKSRPIVGKLPGVDPCAEQIIWSKREDRSELGPCRLVEAGRAGPSKGHSRSTCNHARPRRRRSESVRTWPWACAPRFAWSDRSACPRARRRRLRRDAPTSRAPGPASSSGRRWA